MNAGRATAPLRVVIADDTDDIRLLLRVAFERTPDLVLCGEAANGLEAIRLVGETGPDAIILDLAMPEMDGLQAIPEIRAASPGTKIVVLSGFGRTGMEEEALERGAHAYVEKGTPIEGVLQTIRSVCGVPAPATVAPPEAARADIAIDLLATLGHELSSPVAVISGFAKLLVRGGRALGPDDVGSYAAAIARSGAQLEDLIRAFYDARELATGPIPIERHQVDLDPLVKEAAADLVEPLRPHPIIVEGTTGAAVPADPTRLRAMVQELVINAAKFSSREGPVTVTLAREDGAVTVGVSDRCGGIAEPDRARLFERFGKIRPGGPGMGLGLYVARGVARAHGGELTYHPLEGGCRFILRLPA